MPIDVLAVMVAALDEVRFSAYDSSIFSNVGRHGSLPVLCKARDVMVGWPPPDAGS